MILGWMCSICAMFIDFTVGGGCQLAASSAWFCSCAAWRIFAAGLICGFGGWRIAPGAWSSWAGKAGPRCS